MAKYHIRKTGDAGICSAKPGQCPLGAGEDEHYSSENEARAAYELKQNEEMIRVLTGRNEKLKTELSSYREPDPKVFEKQRQDYSIGRNVEVDGIVFEIQKQPVNPVYTLDVLSGEPHPNLNGVTFQVIFSPSGDEITVWKAEDEDEEQVYTKKLVRDEMYVNLTETKVKALNEAFKYLKKNNIYFPPNAEEVEDYTRKLEWLSNFNEVEIAGHNLSFIDSTNGIEIWTLSKLRTPQVTPVYSMTVTSGNEKLSAEIVFKNGKVLNYESNNVFYEEISNEDKASFLVNLEKELSHEYESEWTQMVSNRRI